MNNLIHTKLINREAKLAVIGLGYVGLPIALEFARKMDVIGFDINKDRVELMKNNIDPSKELESSDFEGCTIEFSANLEDLSEATFFVIAVPTPIDGSNKPNLGPLLGASSTVGKVLKKGDYVVFESTVYPGCTEEDCIPVLEKESGLNFETDFSVGYSPERINPGDKVHTLQNVVKVVSGDSAESLEEIAKVYEEVVEAGVHRASTIKVAEAAKIIENTQRDVNISLINELSKIFDKLEINTYEVLEAAGTKWNFLPFQPGLVGGHCIGVDPYYLTYKAKKVGYHAEIINSGRSVNDSMGFYIGKQTVKKMIAQGKNMNEAKVLIMGATFKENVSDIRNSKVIDVVNELKSFSVEVDLIDPFASSDEMMQEYGVALADKTGEEYDAVIVAVNHAEYARLTEDDFKKYLKDGKGVFVDIKGVFKGQIQDLEYWSL
ncbi:nucleotide sugar dehydrogenase [Brumimicrobium aurantiacum]|uniref:nucleotide sugar dehydrogenase n=1 Tax=Brumimicrobium aurantiacum TaxID=1737063 RepID=UPI00196A6098|nr:nucleotide sugar dehydrogenase [Brumimicrobium aurantiacum]